MNIFPRISLNKHPKSLLMKDFLQHGLFWVVHRGKIVLLFKNVLVLIKPVSDNRLKIKNQTNFLNKFSFVVGASRSQLISILMCNFIHDERQIGNSRTGHRFSGTELRCASCHWPTYQMYTETNVNQRSSDE